MSFSNRILDFLVGGVLNFAETETTSLARFLAMLVDEGWTVDYTLQPDRCITVKIAGEKGEFSYFGTVESTQRAIEEWLRNYTWEDLMMQEQKDLFKRAIALMMKRFNINRSDVYALLNEMEEFNPPNDQPWSDDF